MSEFAPLYDKSERTRLALKIAAVALVCYAAGKWWLLPMLERYAPYANCHQYGILNGVQILIYGIFVAAPIFFALVIAVALAPRSLRILRSQQDPLPGEKVLRKTRYRYGKQALLNPALVLALLLFMFGTSIWGFIQASKLSRHIPPCSAQQQLEMQ